MINADSFERVHNIFYIPCADIEIPKFRSLLNIKPYGFLQRYLLKNSIEQMGIINPIHVRVSKEDSSKYDLIDGFERLNVAKDLGFTSIKSYVYNNLSDAEAIRLYLTIVLETID